MPLPCWLLQLQVAAAPAAEASVLGDLVMLLSRDRDLGQDGPHLLLLAIPRPSRPRDLVILCGCG